MISIAVTGGAASGKSSFCDQFTASLPPGTVRVFSSDEIVADLLGSKDTQEAIRALEGGEGAFPEGKFDKGALRKLVFDNSEFREKLEALLHPSVLERLEKSQDELKSERLVVLLEVPLLYEVEFPVSRDMDLVVAASAEMQRERLIRQRGLTSELAERILGTQLPMEDKVAKGDVVVWNDGPELPFGSQVRHLASRCHNDLK